MTGYGLTIEKRGEWFEVYEQTVGGRTLLHCARTYRQAEEWALDCRVSIDRNHGDDLLSIKAVS